MIKSDIVFPGQYKGEKVVLLARRHWIILGARMLKLFLVLLAFVIGYLVAVNFAPGLLESDYYPVIALGFIGLVMFLWAYFFEIWNDYYLDVWVVTTDRILNIEQEGLFKRVSSEQKIYRIQDITTEIHGMIPTLIDYGNVHIQTAGSKERFVFEQVSKPAEVKKTVLDLHDQYMRNKGDEILAVEQESEKGEIDRLQQRAQDGKTPLPIKQDDTNKQ